MCRVKYDRYSDQAFGWIQAVPAHDRGGRPDIQEVAVHHRDRTERYSIILNRAKYPVKNASGQGCHPKGMEQEEQDEEYRGTDPDAHQVVFEADFPKLLGNDQFRPKMPDHRVHQQAQQKMNDPDPLLLRLCSACFIIPVQCAGERPEKQQLQTEKYKNPGHFPAVDSAAEQLVIDEQINLCRRRKGNPDDSAPADFHLFHLRKSFLFRSFSQGTVNKTLNQTRPFSSASFRSAALSSATVAVSSMRCSFSFRHASSSSSINA